MEPLTNSVVLTLGGWRLMECPFRAAQTPRPAAVLWTNFRLTAPEHIPRQWGQLRVFYLAWNADECRFARSKYHLRLSREQPALYAQVKAHLTAHYGPAWLLAPDGLALTAAELAAARENKA